MEPVVATVYHWNVAARALNDEHLWCAFDLFESLVGVRFERGIAAATRGLVSCDNNFRVALIDACGERVRGEAAEHDRMDGTDPCAGKHGIGGLWDHWHIQDDPVAFANTHLFQHVGELGNTRVEV